MGRSDISLAQPVPGTARYAKQTDHWSSYLFSSSRAAFMLSSWSGGRKNQKSATERRKMATVMMYLEGGGRDIIHDDLLGWGR